MTKRKYLKILPKTKKEPLKYYYKKKIPKYIPKTIYSKHYATGITLSNLNNVLGTSNMSEFDSTPSLNAVAKGNHSYQRIGDTIIIKQIKLRFMITLDEKQNVLTTVHPGVSVRVSLVLDKTCNGVKTNMVNVYTAASTKNILAFRDNNSSSKYRILKTWIYDLNYEAMTYISSSSFPFKYNGKIKTFNEVINTHIPVNFKGDLEDVGNIVDNNLSIFAVSTSDNYARLSYASKIKFIDG